MPGRLQIPPNGPNRPWAIFSGVYSHPRDERFEWESDISAETFYSFTSSVIFVKLTFQLQF